MRFVVFDLVPALLSWEGRDSFVQASLQPGALETVHNLFPDFRLTGIADGDHPASQLRESLERLDLAPYFETVGTSSVFGPTVTPRIVGRMTRSIGAFGRSIVVTGRPRLAEALRRSGIPAVVTDGDLSGTAEEIRRMAAGRVNP